MRLPKTFKAPAPSRRPRRLATILGLAAITALLLSGIAAAEKPTIIKAGNLVLTFNGGVTPKALPKNEFAPIALNLSGKIANADGSHPPALTEVVIDTDKNGMVDVRGVPVCKQSQLEAQTSQLAEKVWTCPASVDTFRLELKPLSLVD